MKARREISAMRARIDACIARAEGVSDTEAQADLAKYICVLSAGYIERSVHHALNEYVGKRANARVLQYVDNKLQSFSGAKIAKILELLRTFDDAWEADLDQALTDEHKNAVGSIVANRHQIAHGRSVDLTLRRVIDYHRQAIKVVDEVMRVCECD